jgi:hypothetical protein
MQKNALRRCQHHAFFDFPASKIMSYSPYMAIFLKIWNRKKFAKAKSPKENIDKFDTQKLKR